MSRRVDPGIIMLDTFAGLLRDLHVATTLLRREPTCEAYAARYVHTMDLIYECVSGYPMDCQTAVDVLGANITRRERDEARGT